MQSGYPDSSFYHALAYGCRWTSRLALTSFERIPSESSSAEESPSGEPISVEYSPDPPQRSLVQEGRHLWRSDDGLRYQSTHGPVYDTFAGERILVSGPRPNLDLPLAFYGTVASVLLAWRGLIPIHGSAVSWNGAAILLCGASGVGKSTLTAALLSRGAELLSDDLSLLHATDPGHPLRVFSGRSSLRLFPETAAALAESVSFREPSRPADHKLAVFPQRANPWTSLPLRGLVLLGEGPAMAATLADQLFRPQAMRAIPGQRWRLSTLAFAASHLTTLRLSPGPIRSPDSFHRAADALVQALQSVGL